MFLITVAAIWGIAAITPGPNFLIVARCSLGGNRGNGLAAVSGTICGTIVWGLAGWLGVSALFAAAPAAFVALKIIGGAYLVWLGARLLLASRQGTASAPPAEPLGLTRMRAFRLGLITNLANPKSAIFVASLFATALPADYRWTDGLAAVVIMVTISTLWYAALALLLSRPSVSRVYARMVRWIDAAVGAIFVGFGAKLILFRAT